MSPSGGDENPPDSESDAAATPGAPSRPAQRGDENLPDSKGDAAAAEAGREASSLSGYQAVSITWEGPLPPPAVLEQYDQVVPGLARQIAEQVKIEAGHVQEQENNTLKAAIRDREAFIRLRARGQCMAFSAVMAVIFLAGFALWMGAPWVAVIAVSIVVGTASVFVLEPFRKRKNKDDKDQDD